MSPTSQLFDAPAPTGVRSLSGIVTLDRSSGAVGPAGKVASQPAPRAFDSATKSVDVAALAEAPQRSGGLEGVLQIARRSLEPSFEAC